MGPTRSVCFSAVNPLYAPMLRPTKVAPPGTAMAAAQSASPSQRAPSPTHKVASSAASLAHQFASSTRAPPPSTVPVKQRDTKIDLQRIRTISIVAHIDAGKTTVTERMLYYAGVVKRIGEVDSGTTTTDFMKEEMERGITIQAALVTLQWNQHSIYLLDTPGHADFTVEVERSVRVADGVVALLDASAGVQAQSYTVMAQAVRFSVPIIAFINKMDKSNADFSMSIDSIRSKLHVDPLVMQLPLQDERGALTGLINLVDLCVYQFQGEHGEDVVSFPVCDANGLPSATDERCLSPAEVEKALVARHTLLTQLTAADDKLSEELIHALDATEGDEAAAERRLSSSAIEEAVRRVLISPPPASSNKSTREGRPRRIILPVFCGAARRNQGVQPLLDAITKYLPSPLERKVVGYSVESGAVVKMDPHRLAPSSAHAPSIDTMRASVALMKAPFLALAFKVCHTANPATGKREPLVYIRVYTGVLKSAAVGGVGLLYNRSRSVEEKVGTLFVVHANTPVEVNELRPGEVGAIFLKYTFASDTLYAPLSASGLGKRSGEVAGFASVPSSFRRPSEISDAEQDKRKIDAGRTLAARSVVSYGDEHEEFFSSLLEGIDSPPPVIRYAIEAATTDQAQKLDVALAELTREDSSIAFFTDEYGSRVLQGLGELHLEVALSRLRHEYALECRLLRAVVEYRETMVKERKVENLIVSHHGAPYAEVTISVCPLLRLGKEEEATAEEMYAAEATPRLKLAPSVVGHLSAATASSDSRQMEVNRRAEEQKNMKEWCRALEHSFQLSVDEVSRMGPLASMPLHGLLFTLHSFRRLGDSSSPMSSLPPDPKTLRGVARQALLALLRLEGDSISEDAPSAMKNTSRPSKSASDVFSILEPMMELEVHLSDVQYTSDVVRLLNGRRATWIDSTTTEGCVLGLAPMRCLGKISGALRAAVKGHASLSMRLRSYQLVTDENERKKILKSRGCL